MTVFNPLLRQYVEQCLSEVSEQVFQISGAENLAGLQFRPMYALDAPKLVKSGGYSRTGADTPISFRFPAIIERAMVGPYGHQFNMPRDSWNISHSLGQTFLPTQQCFPTFPPQYTKVKDIKHRIMVTAPHGLHLAWFRNLYKRAFRNLRALEALGPSAPHEDSGERFSALKNIGGVPQLQISWKIWEKIERNDASYRHISSGNIALSGKQTYTVDLLPINSAPTQTTRMTMMTRTMMILRSSHSFRLRCPSPPQHLLQNWVSYLALY